MTHLKKYIASSSLLLASCLLSPLSSATNSHTNTTDSPIHFAKGSIVTTVKGVLQPDERADYYHFEAQKGQYAIVNIRSAPPIEEIANVGMLTMPSGKEQGDKGSIVFQDCLAETGTYKLGIHRNLMATYNGKAGYNAEIILLPPYFSKDLCQ